MQTLVKLKDTVRDLESGKIGFINRVYLGQHGLYFYNFYGDEKKLQLREEFEKVTLRSKKKEGKKRFDWLRNLL